MLQASDGRSLFEQVSGRQIPEPEELPPLGLALSAMPVDQIGEQPHRMLRVIRRAGLDGQIAQQLLARGLLSRFQFADVLAGIALLG